MKAHCRFKVAAVEHMEIVFGLSADFARQAFRVRVRLSAGEVLSPEGVSR
jgi:hypothetical protein